MMPVAHAAAGCLRSLSRPGLAMNRAMPGSEPMAKQMAESWNGGIAPEAAVNSASRDHMRMAEKPISVARIFNGKPSGYCPNYPSKCVAFMVRVPNLVGTEKNTGAYTFIRSDF